MRNTILKALGALTVGALGVYGYNVYRKDQSLVSPPAQIVAAKLTSSPATGAFMPLTIGRKKQTGLALPKTTPSNADFFRLKGAQYGRNAAEQSLAFGESDIVRWIDEGRQLVEKHSEKPGDMADNMARFHQYLVQEFNRALAGLSAVTTNIIPDNGKTPEKDDFYSDRLLVHLRGQAPNVPKGWKVRPGYASRAPETPPFLDV